MQTEILKGVYTFLNKHNYLSTINAQIKNSQKTKQSKLNNVTLHVYAFAVGICKLPFAVVAQLLIPIG